MYWEFLKNWIWTIRNSECRGIGIIKEFLICEIEIQNSWAILNLTNRNIIKISLECHNWIVLGLALPSSEKHIDLALCYVQRVLGEATLFSILGFDLPSPHRYIYLAVCYVEPKWHSTLHHFWRLSFSHMCDGSPPPPTRRSLFLNCPLLEHQAKEGTDDSAGNSSDDGNESDLSIVSHVMMCSVFSACVVTLYRQTIIRMETGSSTFGAWAVRLSAYGMCLSTTVSIS